MSDDELLELCESEIRFWLRIPDGHKQCGYKIASALKSRIESQAVPDGWKLVPVEPKEGMVIYGFEAVSEFQDTDEYQEMSGCQRAAKSAQICYRSMLAAAPAPPTRAHSKSEYKRLSAQGVDVLPPTSTDGGVDDK